MLQKSSKPSYKEPRDAAQSVPCCCALHRVLAARLGLRQCTRESAETHGNQGAFLEVTLWGWVSKGNQENPNGFPLSKHTHWLALGNPRLYCVRGSPVFWSLISSQPDLAGAPTLHEPLKCKRGASSVPLISPFSFRPILRAWTSLRGTQGSCPTFNLQLAHGSLADSQALTASLSVLLDGRNASGRSLSSCFLVANFNPVQQ